MVWFFLILGLVLLAAGGEALVRGSSSLALRLGVTPLVIGLTVVAMGTSAPEAVVSIIATAQGSPDVAVGNVVGSNIFNVLLVLGISAVVAPLFVAQVLIRRDVPIMITSALLVGFFALDGRISLTEGLLLVVGLASFVIFTVRESRTETAKIVEEYDAAARGPLPGSWLADILFVGAGLALLVVGARWLVGSAVTLAASLGIDETVTGLTIVAAGTSLPEVATSIVATVRGQRDIAVGNVVGSNIFNTLGILGLASLSSGGALRIAPAIQTFDMPVMIAVCLACAPIFFTGARISRWEGFLFLGYYVAYTTFLVLNATDHAALPIYRLVMLEFVVPLTIVTLGVVLYRAWKSPASPSEA